MIAFAPRKWWLAALVACTAGCATVDPSEEPAELTEFKPSLDVRVMWRHGLSEDMEDLLLGLAPASDGVHAYAATHDGVVSAFRLDDGRRVWRTRLTHTEPVHLRWWHLIGHLKEWLMPAGQRLSAGPGVAEGLVVVGSSDGEVSALRASDGTLLWAVKLTGEVLSAPAIAGGVVVVRTVDGQLTALAANDGHTLWRVAEDLPPLTLRGNAAPVVAGQTVVAGFDNGKLAAYDLATGTMQWQNALATPAGRTDIEKLVDIDGAMRVLGSTVYAAAHRGHVAAVSLETGDVVWSQELSSHRGLAVDYGAVYVTSDNGEVWAYDRNGGAPLWNQDALRARRLTAPVRVGDALVVGDFEGYLHFLDRFTGALAARVRVGSGAIVLPPVAVNDTVIALTEEGDLAAVRAALPPEKGG
ncbi:MAG TPA: outer membrane protein assembly factor BamB [Gammaproteobacteria bacterium]|nr:outer membrane protein assembly factor BamB [Gammaproteobacteria bacterium]